MQRLTVGSRRAVEPDLHGNIQPVLHHERGANGDHLPGTTLHRDGEHHPDRRQRGELKVGEERLKSRTFPLLDQQRCCDAQIRAMLVFLMEEEEQTYVDVRVDDVGSADGTSNL